MQLAVLDRLALTGNVFDSSTAQRSGLIAEIISEDDHEKRTQEEIELLLNTSPQAHTAYKELRHDLREHDFRQSEKTAIAIAQIRASSEGQHGLKSFLNKQKPEWSSTLSNDSRNNTYWLI